MIFLVNIDKIPPQLQSGSLLFLEGDIKKWFEIESYGTTTFTGDVFPYTTSSATYFDGSNVMDFQSVLNDLDFTAPNFNIDDYDYLVFITCHDAAVYRSITSDKTFTINGVQYTQSVISTSYQNGNWYRDL